MIIEKSTFFYAFIFILNYLNIKFVTSLIGPRLNNKNLYNLVSKLNSIFHSIYIVYYSHQLLKNPDEYKIEFFNALNVTRGYLLYDTIMMIIFRKHATNFNLMLIHHLVFFLVVCSNVVYELPILTARGLYAEVTNPFLYLGWFLIKLN